MLQYNISHTCRILSSPKFKKKKKKTDKIKIKNFEFEAPHTKFSTLTRIFWLKYISTSYYSHLHYRA